MEVTHKLLIDMKACSNQRDLFCLWLNGRKSVEFSVDNMLSADGIGLDVVWLGVRLLPLTVGVQFAAECAQHVLPLFETQYPNDLKPRRAIQLAHNFQDYVATTIINYVLDADDSGRKAYIDNNMLAVYPAYAAACAASSVMYYLRGAKERSAMTIHHGIVSYAMNTESKHWIFNRLCELVNHHDIS